MESDKSISAPSDVNSDSVPRTRPLHGRTSGPARRSTKGQWTAEEDEILRKAVQRFKGKNWKKIAECFKDRTDVQCLHRWQKVLNPELIKGPWSKEEDETIIELVKKFGPKKWSTIAQHLPGRIGKQCRERWHNHLNPAINKEAWTQEEELALIRAHQIYGNRWAELTKFLPGRTDNAIKNHWNSSVKKKLDSYLSSGLLEQLPAIPLVAHQSQNVASCSSRIQTSGDNGGQKAEEVSECSQESVVGCSQAANDFANPVLHAREEFQFNEESGFRNEQISSPGSCSEQHYTSLRDVPFSIPEVPCEAGASSFLQNNFPYNSATSASMNYQVNLQELPNISSLQLCQEPSGMPIHSIISHDNHELMNFPFETSAGDIAAKGDQMFISDEEFCRILFSDAVNGGTFSPGTVSKGSHMLDLDEATDPLLLHSSSDIKVSEGDKPSAIQSYCPSTSGALGTSSSQPILSSPMLLTANDITLANQSINIQVSEGDRPAALQTYVPAASGVLGTSCSHSVLSTPMLVAAGDNTLASQSVNHSFGTQREEVTTIVHDDFIYANDNVNTPGGDGTYDTDLQEQPYLEEAKKLVPVSSFNSGVGTVQSNPATEMPDIQMEQQDAGALCYEPPRFPSFDIPFLSCDLIPAGGDIQQEYSPLGIRQLMMSSMNCISPFRLWGSPARDDSPDAVLRSAAKTFTGTPSILKKRTRDLLSPLSDRRDDKKLEIDMTSNLTKEFSRLDVMFDEAATQRAPIQSPSFDRRSNGSSSEDKENRDPALDSRQEEGSDATTALSENKTSHKDVARSNSGENRLQLVADSNTYNCGPPNPCMEKPLGVLLDDNLQEILLFSPDQVGFKADRVFGSNTRTPRNLYHKILGTLSEQAISETSSGNPCLVVSSPSVGRKKNDSLSVIATTSAQSLPSSAALNNVLDSAENYAGIESLSIFGETPFKRSFESPSAWKSPWFINSFLPGPKVDTDISIEDIGYFSPADRSYDAIALIKQLNEQTASAYADALEVLGNETPETLSKRKGANNQTADQENNHHSQLASNVMSECRILDFSECGTPKKGTESRKTSSSSNLSSPSSYLLKGCR